MANRTGILLKLPEVRLLACNGQIHTAEKTGGANRVEYYSCPECTARLTVTDKPYGEDIQEVIPGNGNCTVLGYTYGLGLIEP